MGERSYELQEKSRSLLWACFRADGERKALSPAALCLDAQKSHLGYIYSLCFIS